jgi:hypothetical protein
MDADDPMDTISSSTGLTGGVDGPLILKRDRGSADAYLHVDGRDVEGACEYALKWDNDLTSWQLLGDANEYRVGETRSKILKLLSEAHTLEDCKGMQAKDIAVEAGVSSETARRTLSRMNQDGQILKVAYGRYCHTCHSVTLPQNDGKSDSVTTVTPGERSSGENGSNSLELGLNCDTVTGVTLGDGSNGRSDSNGSQQRSTVTTVTPPTRRGDSLRSSGKENNVVRSTPPGGTQRSEYGDVVAPEEDFERQLERRKREW